MPFITIQQKILCALVLLILHAAQAYAVLSGGGDDDDVVGAIISEYADYEQDSEVDAEALWDEYGEVIAAMATEKRNINDMTMDDLLQVPLLDERCVNALLDYRARYGDIRIMSELSMIPALDVPQRHLIQLLFYAAPHSPTQSLRHDDGKHEMMATLKLPLYTRKGYETPTSSGGYHGANFANTLRYRYDSHTMTIALTASQDYGEPFFAGSNAKGWDSYVGYLRLKNRGIVKNLIAGHFKVSSGMGLVVQSGLRQSRAMMLSAFPASSFTLRGHSSRSQQDFMQGVAVTLAMPQGRSGAGENTRTNRMPSFSLSAYASVRPIDASLSTENAGDGTQTITSILTTGYHRTDTEIERRNTAVETDLGLNVTGRMPMTFGVFTAGVNALYTHLSKPLLPNKKQLYRYFLPQGNDFLSGSMTYGFVSPSVQITGETALSQPSAYAPATPRAERKGVALATMNNVRWKLNERVTLLASQRYYNYRYQSLHGQSFGDVANVQNESGAYLGLLTPLGRHLKLSAYVDCAYHPWARFGFSPSASQSPSADSQGNSTASQSSGSTTQCSSKSWDHYLDLAYEKGLWQASLHYRYRENAWTSSASVMPDFTSSIDGKSQHSARLKVRHSAERWWVMSQMQGALVVGKDVETSAGCLLSQTVGYKRMKRKTAELRMELMPDGEVIPYDSLAETNVSEQDRIVFSRYTERTTGYSLSATATYFNTADYASRLYLQEPTLRYGSISTMLYGRGYRLSALASTTVWRGLSLSVCFALNHYLDRKEIGSGMQTIKGNTQADAVVQMSWKL